MNDFSSFKNRYILKANIKFESPLHIGIGISLEPAETDSPIIKRDEIPYIPGSSIKGILRTFFEKFLRRMDSQKLRLNGQRIWACDILTEEDRCISPRKGLNPNRISIEELENESKENGKINEEKLTQKILENLCTACRLFGSHEMASKIYIKDAYLVQEKAFKTEIRDGVAIDRDTGTTKVGAKFDYEVIPPGSKFQFEAILENVDDWEVGLLGMILKFWERSGINIGGKSSTGLGWSKIEDLKIELIKDENLLDFIINDKIETANLENFLTQLHNTLKKEGDI